MTKSWASDLPCELCGPDGQCTCGPCSCVWCRYERDECTDAERRMIAARDRAFAAHDARQSARKMAVGLGEAIERYKMEGQS